MNQSHSLHHIRNLKYSGMFYSFTSRSRQQYSCSSIHSSYLLFGRYSFAAQTLSHIYSNWNCRATAKRENILWHLLNWVLGDPFNRKQQKDNYNINGWDGRQLCVQYEDVGNGCCISSVSESKLRLCFGKEEGNLLDWNNIV